MGRLVYRMMTSLDGYCRDAEGSFAWSEPGLALHAWINERERGIGTEVYGAAMWESMSYWVDPPAETLAVPVMREYTDVWAQKNKVVVSASLEPPTAPRTELWRELDLDRLSDLVRTSDHDVSISGPTLAAVALHAGLVDEIGAYVLPHVAGGGLPFLPPGYSTGLTLREQRSFECGAVIVTYDVNRSA